MNARSIRTMIQDIKKFQGKIEEKKEKGKTDCSLLCPPCSLGIFESN